MDDFSARTPQSVPRHDDGLAHARLPWLLGMLILLLILWLLPNFVERISYSVSRGRQRADVEDARERLGDPMLTDISRQFGLVAKAIGPSVVHIDTVQVVTENGDEWTNLFAPRQYQAQGQGSGVIVDEAGYILTNYHVVENAREIQVKLSDNETQSGEVVGLDPGTDLAVLRIRPGGLIAAQWGDSDMLQAGSLVWAVGNPLGLDRSVTFGIISAKNRRGLTGSPYQDFLQTDAAVNPGNSGGPLVDVAGKIVGINTAIAGRAQGIGFSIPSRLAKEVYEKLRSSGKVERGWLGVELTDITPELARKFELKTLEGALVTKVLAGAPADKAGIQPGDAIVEWNGHPLADATELTLLVGKTEIGSQATAIVVRDGQRTQIEIKIEPRPTISFRR